jgi:predicted ester cyclase
MSVEENKELIRRLKAEVINAKDAQAADRFFADSYRNDVPGRQPGSAGLKLALEEFFVAFPDIQETIDEIIGEGNVVASWSTIRATHRGPFMGVPGTGKPVTFTIQELSRVAEGKVQEQRVSFDLFGLMAQIRPPEERANA